MTKNRLCKRLAVALVALLGTTTAWAQEGAPLRVLEFGADARTQALGGTHLATQSSNHLYTNPTHIFAREARLSVYVGGELLPKYAEVGRETFGVASVGVRLHERHALLAGVRYLSGLSIPRVNGQGVDVGGESKPNQTVLDLGYSYNATEHLSAYAVGSMIRSVSSRRTTNYTFGFGLSYRNRGDWFSGALPTEWRATLAVAHLGQDLDYGDGVRFRMPSTVSLALGATSRLGADHSLGLQLQGGYVTSYKETALGVGASYCYRKLVGLHTGYQHQGKGLDFYGLGLSCSVGKVSLDLSYRWGLGEFTQNSLALGASLSL